MHSAEHILNRTMVRLFNCGRSFSAHIEAKKSKVDYHFERDLTKEEIAEIERKVNEIIAADMAVTVEFMPRIDAEKIFNLGKLPDDAGDPLRIIHLGNYDACPCIGAHVPTTKQIGEFRIISTGYENGILRVRFKLNHGDME